MMNSTCTLTRTEPPAASELPATNGPRVAGRTNQSREVQPAVKARTAPAVSHTRYSLLATSALKAFTTADHGENPKKANELVQIDSKLRKPGSVEQFRERGPLARISKSHEGQRAVIRPAASYLLCVEPCGVRWLDPAFVAVSGTAHEPRVGPRLRKRFQGCTSKARLDVWRL